MEDARFTRRARLANRAGYRYVFEQPVKSSSRWFTVLSRHNGLDYCRLGLVVSRKTARSAVARNRIKRMIRESFRNHQQELKGFDIVVIGRPNLQDTNNAVLRDALKRHWTDLVKRLP